MINLLTAKSTSLILGGLLTSGLALARDYDPFPIDLPTGPSDLYPEGPDFPAGPDLGEFPGIPGSHGNVLCISIFTPTGETFTASGNKSTAAARALEACQSWQNHNDSEGMGDCRILNCESLIDTI